MDSLAAGRPAADLRRAHARRRVQHRRAPRHRRPPTSDRRRLSGGRAPRCERWLAENLPQRARRARHVQRRRGRRTSPRAAPMPASAPRSPRKRFGLDTAGRRRRRRAERAHPVRPGRAAGTAAGAHRSRPHVGGAAARQRSRGAGVGDDRVRDPRHRPHPHRIPADPNRIGHLHLLPGLRRAHRRRSGGQALKALHRRCRDVRYLGSWPTGAAVGAGTAIDGRGDAVAGGPAGGARR